MSYKIFLRLSLIKADNWRLAKAENWRLAKSENWRLAKADNWRKVLDLIINFYNIINRKNFIQHQIRNIGNNYFFVENVQKGAATNVVVL